MHFNAIFLVTVLFALPACAVLSPPPVGNRAVPEPVRAVDLDRYLGRWYELYRYDASFQKDCEAVTADYTRNADGSLRVLNSCRLRTVDGPVKTATGKAKVADTVTGAKLKVSFFGPFYGDYWVLDRDEDYRWSIVGEPSGHYLWVLSRAPQLSESAKSMLRQRVQDLGYDWSLVRETRHQSRNDPPPADR